MNSQYLGDAFDFWKGSLLSLLLKKGLIENVVVDPMITDAQRWGNAEVQTYKRLLSLDVTCTVFHCGSTFSGGRSDYFNEVPPDGDIFLDPDIGIATGKATRKHVQITEIEKLLGQSERIVMVYQHSPLGGNFHQRLSALKSQITDSKATDGSASVHCAVYHCGQVAMLFISLSRGRIADIEKALQKHLCVSAQWRVW